MLITILLFVVTFLSGIITGIGICLNVITKKTYKEIKWKKRVEVGKYWKLGVSGFGWLSICLEREIENEYKTTFRNEPRWYWKNM